MSKLVGVVEKKGTYEGRDYHLLKLHVTEPADSNIGAGIITEVVSIRMAKLEECFGKGSDVHTVVSLIGKEMSFGYDKYKVCNQVRIIE